MSVGENCPNCGHALGYRETISTETKQVQQRHLACPASGCGFESEDVLGDLETPAEIA